MTAYVAILEDAGPSTAVGVWFPDLPGCFSAGDDVDEALRKAGDAIAAYAEALAQDGRALPTPRTLSVLRNDPEVTSDIRDYVVALNPVPTETIPAAEEREIFPRLSEMGRAGSSRCLPATDALA